MARTQAKPARKAPAPKHAPPAPAVRAVPSAPLTLAQVQAVVAIMCITGDMSDEQRRAWDTILLLVPWYARQADQSIDDVWHLPAEGFAADLVKRMPALVSDSLFKRATVTVGNIVAELGKVGG